MPVVKTHNGFDGKEEPSQGSFTVNELVNKITFDILKSQPSLFLEVEMGRINRTVLETEIIKNIDKNRYFLGITRDELISQVFEYAFGYGPLEKYIRDETLSDIDGTRYDHFTAKRFGKKIPLDVKFSSVEEFLHFCHLVILRKDGILNENYRDSQCRVSDEKERLRINVAIPPRNRTGPSIAIRKHPLVPYRLPQLEEMGMYTAEMRKFFEDLAYSRCNVLVLGKGGSGKTTLLRALAYGFPSMDRVLTCESDVELYLDDLPNVISQRIKKANEGGHPLTLRDIIRDGLTMSLDTYIIGEIVADEAWEFLKACHSGHRGLATTHAESAPEGISRLITLIKSAGVDHTEKTLRRMLSQSVDVVVYLRKFKAMEVLEVSGYDEGKDEILYNPLFGFNVDWETDESVAGSFFKVNDIGERIKSKLYKKGGPMQ